MTHQSQFELSVVRLDGPTARVQMAETKLVDTKKGATWSESAGTGGRKGAWGISGSLGSLVAYVGTILLVTLCPAITIYM